MRLQSTDQNLMILKRHYQQNMKVLDNNHHFSTNVCLLNNFNILQHYHFYRLYTTRKHNLNEGGFPR